jgi:hypothetical protein
MDRNVKDLWTSLRTQALRDWSASVEETLYPELEARGIKVNSKTVMDPAPGNEYLVIWFCSKGDNYLEIHMHTANGFSTVSTKDAATTWPTLPSSTYDRQNYTLAYLLAWLDKWIA